MEGLKVSVIEKMFASANVSGGYFFHQRNRGTRLMNKVKIDQKFNEKSDRKQQRGKQRHL